MRRTAGSVGRTPGWLRLAVFFAEPQILEERERDHAQHSVMVQSMPGTPLEVVEAEFLLHLLVHLLARPTCLDGGHNLLDGR